MLNEWYLRLFTAIITYMNFVNYTAIRSTTIVVCTYRILLYEFYTDTLANVAKVVMQIRTVSSNVCSIVPLALLHTHLPSRKETFERDWNGLYVQVTSVNIIVLQHLFALVRSNFFNLMTLFSLYINHILLVIVLSDYFKIKVEYKEYFSFRIEISNMMC
jgi:hypothetical protein